MENGESVVTVASVIQYPYHDTDKDIVPIFGFRVFDYLQLTANDVEPEQVNPGLQMPIYQRNIQSVYSLKQAPKFLQDLAKDFNGAAQAGMLSAGLKLVQYIQTQIIPRTIPPPVDRGLYRAGWRVVPIKGDIGKTSGVYVYNPVPHAFMVEYGVKNVKVGPKLIEALMKWAKRKGIGSRIVSDNKGGYRIKKASDSELRSTAYAIALGAKKRGGFFRQGNGLRVLERAMQVAPQIVIDEVTAEIKRATK